MRKRERDGEADLHADGRSEVRQAHSASDPLGALSMGSAAFVKSLAAVAMGAQRVLWLEGSRLPGEIRGPLAEWIVQTPPPPGNKRGTAWPTPILTGVEVNEVSMSRLTEAFDAHAASEVCDHLHVASKDGWLAHWYDVDARGGGDLEFEANGLSPSEREVLSSAVRDQQNQPQSLPRLGLILVVSGLAVAGTVWVVAPGQNPPWVAVLCGPAVGVGLVLLLVGLLRGALRRRKGELQRPRSPAENGA
jgi:hypothetical protein